MTMSWPVYETIFMITAGFWKKFYSNRGHSEYRREFFEGVPKRVLRLVLSVVTEGSKTLDFLKNKDTKNLKNTNAYSESTD
jgi:hypothetical protein